LRQKYDEYSALDTIIAPILVDKLENAQKMEEKYAKNKFPILYDKTKKVSKMLHQEIKILKLGRMPGLIIVDKQGIIQFAYYGENMQDIPKNRDVLEILRKMEGKE
jgi:peroxiredoxin